MYKEIFKSMDESIAVCKVTCDDNGEPLDFTCIDTNPAFEKTLGLKKEDVIGKSVSEVIEGLDKEIVKEYGKVALGQKRIKETRYVEFFKKYFKIQVFSHEIGKFCIMFTDVTELKKFELLLEKYKLLFDYARDIIMFIDMDGNILEANDTAVKIYGYTKEELTKMKIFDLRYDKVGFVKEQMSKANAEGILFETEHKGKEGRPIPVEISSIGTTINDKPVLLSIVREITEQKKAREKITRLAYYDTLTQVPNRRFFKDKLEDALYSARRDHDKVAIMFLDIDKFKYVNDTFGHSVGDMLLIEVARRMESIISEGTIVARLGGDEFVILQPRVIKEDDLKSIAENVNTVINKKFILASKDIHVSTSIGISVYPIDGQDSEELMRKADIAMYEVKNRGGNGYQFYDSTSK